MHYSRLGRTNLRVSLMGLGSGGHDPFGQRHKGIPEADIHRLIHRALGLGVNLFDTAPAYMDSELILGRALKRIPRDRYLLSTKVGLVKDAAGTELATEAEIVNSVEASLRRLNVDVIDLLLVGGFVSEGAYPRIVADQIPVLRRLKQAGKIRYLGATEKSSDDGAHTWLARSLQDDLFDVVMVAYNLINQSAEQTVFPLCRQKDVGVMAIYTVRSVFSNTQRLQEIIADFKARGLIPSDSLPETDPLGWLLDADTGSLIEAAYRFVAHHDAVSTVMTGTTNIQHLENNIAMIDKPPLPAEKIDRLRHLFGHITEVVGN